MDKPQMKVKQIITSAFESQRTISMIVSKKTKAEVSEFGHVMDFEKNDEIAEWRHIQLFVDPRYDFNEVATYIGFIIAPAEELPF